MAHDRIFLHKVRNSLLTDLAQIDQVMKEYAGFADRYAGHRDPALCRALASYLTDFYLGVESILKTIAEEIDGGAPYGRKWHERLFASMAVGKKDVRPPVISPELHAALTPFLAFRHVIPQAYGCSFDEKELAALERQFLSTRERFSAEMRTFFAFLEDGAFPDTEWD